MAFGDRLLELIGGSDFARSLEMKRISKYHEQLGTEEKMRRVRNVTYGGLVDVPLHPESIAERSRNDTLATQAGGYTRPPLQRSQSNLSAESRLLLPTTPNPPLKTTNTTALEDLKRTCSLDDVWQQKGYALPPLPEMVGFGRWRRAKNATLDWQVRQLARNNAFERPQQAEAFAQLALGPSEKAIETYKQHLIARSDSFGSSYSSGAEGGLPLQEIVDLPTGTMYSFGFDPSSPSSMASSLRCDSQSSSGRQYLANSSANSSDEGQHKKLESSGNIPKTFPRLPGLVAARSRGMHIKPKKIERPCAFDDDDNTGSAFISDDSEPEDATRERPPSRIASSLLSEQIRAHSNSSDSNQRVRFEDDSTGPTQKLELTRSNTVKRASKPCMKRQNSQDKKRSKQNQPKTTFAAPVTRRPTVRRVNSHYKNHKKASKSNSSDAGELTVTATSNDAGTTKETTESANPLEHQFVKEPVIEQHMPSTEVVSELESDESTLLATCLNNTSEINTEYEIEANVELKKSKRRARSGTAIRLPGAAMASLAT